MKSGWKTWQELKAKVKKLIIERLTIGYVVLALNKMGKRKEAKELFSQWTRLYGFREWYNAETGQGGGAQKQMWSAALYIAAGRSLGLIN